MRTNDQRAGEPAKASDRLHNDKRMGNSIYDRGRNANCSVGASIL